MGKRDTFLLNFYEGEKKLFKKGERKRTSLEKGISVQKKLRLALTLAMHKKETLKEFVLVLQEAAKHHSSMTLKLLSSNSSKSPNTPTHLYQLYYYIKLLPFGTMVLFWYYNLFPSENGTVKCNWNRLSACTCNILDAVGVVNKYILLGPLFYLPV